MAPTITADPEAIAPPTGSSSWRRGVPTDGDARRFGNRLAAANRAALDCLTLYAHGLKRRARHPPGLGLCRATKRSSPAGEKVPTWAGTPSGRPRDPACGSTKRIRLLTTPTTRRPHHHTIASTTYIHPFSRRSITGSPTASSSTPRRAGGGAEDPENFIERF